MILDDELMKILLCLIKILEYLNEAWGIITTHTTVYIVQAAYEDNGDIG